MTSKGPVGSVRIPRSSAVLAYDRRVAPFSQPFARAAAATARCLVLSSVIDHGAGTGLVTRLVQAQHPLTHVYALDPAAQLLSGLSHNSRTTPLVGTALDLDRLAPGLLVDFVISNLVLMFCPDPVTDLAALRRHTRPAGVLAISVLGAAPSVEPFHRYWSAVSAVVGDAWPPERYPHHRFATAESLQQVAEQAGWKDITVSAVRGTRRLGASFAWEWLNGVLPVGVGNGYVALSADARQSVRQQFCSRWGDIQTVTSAGWVLKGRNPGPR